ncbi:1,4-alpha-glucan branching protein [Tessaracoccus flavus]|uniref:1,4-alpha-glucan branching enzyme n=2 Tax=Tessaracoccus flavus TaxID=1610493 RepID=A0A1Q2CGS6_9ACTN|nr:1,4-alpha-glucan branching protein [Tessaracoccus flavus]
MGAIPAEGGVAFRVWAPNADSVAVVGDFNDWNDSANALDHEGNGYWYGFVKGAQPGHEYKYQITNGDNSFSRVDPYALQVTNSVGNGVIYDHDSFDWEDVQANCPPHHELVIYEMHIGTFTDKGDWVGNLTDAVGRLDHLVDLGVNAIEVMPVAEFAGDMSWGYNPAHIFAVESAYGGPNEYKKFIKECHQRGIAVIQDVVYNHFGPSDLDLWAFDGWQENGKGGIYFYNDDRSETPWGDTRPDYGREEVRNFIVDNALMWLRDYRVDGLRLDMVPHMYSHQGSYLAEGWSLMRRITDAVRNEFPGRITIAEDLHKNPLITEDNTDGAGFHAQWDAAFVHPVRAELINPDDAQRSIQALADAIAHHYGDPLERVIYTESHDEVANGSARVPQEIEPDNAAGWPSQKRSTIGAALVMTSPGIPMMFQGQEFLEGAWFRDDVPLDWRRRDDFSGIARLYADLIDLRLNRWGVTRGLTGRGVNIHHINEDSNLLVFQRWLDHGPGDDVVVVANLSAEPQEYRRVGLPSGGLWKLRFNSDATIYSGLFGNYESHDMEAYHEDADGMDWHGNVSVGPYSVLVYSQDN